MLAVAPLRNTRDEAGGESNFSIIGDDFPDLSGDNLLDSIDFDDIFDGMEDEDHVLPALEMESDIFAEFSVSGGEDSETNATTSSVYFDVTNVDDKICTSTITQEEDKVSGSGLGLESGSNSFNQGDEIVNKKRDGSGAANVPSAKETAERRKKSSKNNQGNKRKVKVDWTPELHRRFVQAVEQLGVDKAVPSRILELMGIDCLTRHNIASHLQKYRSHRKHLLAREAEAASWTQRRQVYGGAATGGGCKREMSSSPWLAPPTIGFPPMAPPNIPHFRPLHVWGHPSVNMENQPLVHMTWPPKHNSSRSPLSPIWPPATPSPHLPQPPLTDPSFWHSRHQRVPHSQVPAATHCIPPPVVPMRFPTAAVAPVPGIPPHAMYKVDPINFSATAPAPARQTCPHPPFDVFHPSKESIDAAIGDVLSKPWLPLPLGLKPPSTDSVVVELHRQGVEKIPPSCASS